MKVKISVIGLGYVGLPLAIEFSKFFPTVGYDINSKRIDELRQGKDHTLELDDLDIKKNLVDLNPSINQNGFYPSNLIEDIKNSNFYIVTVPTPVDKNNRPNLNPLISACKTVGSILKENDTVVFESTVYPGATEEECVPVLEKESSLVLNKDFYVGYSPERINPGDKERTLTKITKLISGSNKKSAIFIDKIYSKIINAGTYVTSSIKVAEAAKVIENTQRDINIAFVNELAIIFNKMKIDTNEVLDAAATKWNFLPFKPGLVGGHCIGVDPYYLAQKSIDLGYNPNIILSGRNLNDSMGRYVADLFEEKLIENSINTINAEVLVLGITFKENCPDIRNTKVVDMIKSLKEKSFKLNIYDPWASKEEVNKEYGIEILNNIPNKKFDGIILAVSHDLFKKIDISNFKSNKSIVFDIKGFYSKDADYRL